MNIPPGSAERGYVAGKAEFHYPALGDQTPPGGADVLLKTRGGICIRGKWTGDQFFVAWSPMPKGDKDKEQRMRELGLMD
jgi:hypothetical protein